MTKQKAIVDTCLLQKISSNGKYAGNIKKIFDNLDYILVAHRYVVDHEFGLHSYIKRLIDEGYITTIEYDEFFGEDDFSRMIYETQFEAIYNEMRNYLQRKGGIKQMPKLVIPNGKDIYSHHIQGSSMGDVHMIIMASFMRIPVFLSDDFDIGLLRDIAKRRLSLSSYQLKIVNSFNLLVQIAENPDVKMTHKEFETIVKQTGERENWKTINAIWNSKRI